MHRTGQRLWIVLVAVPLLFCALSGNAFAQAGSLKRQILADAMGKVLSAAGKPLIGGALPAFEHIISNFSKMRDPCGNGVKMLTAIYLDSAEPQPTGTSYALYIKSLTKDMDPLAVTDALKAYVGARLAQGIKDKRKRGYLGNYIRKLKVTCNSEAWKTDYGTMLLPKNLAFRGVYEGYYSEDGGRIFGRFDQEPGKFIGIWTENGSARKCATAKYGSEYWGKIKFSFYAQKTKFTGRWGYCDDKPESTTLHWGGAKQ